MREYPAITIWQPWATLIARGCKVFEFRSWPAPQAFHGKRIAIHAGSRTVKRFEVTDLIYKLQNPKVAAATGIINHAEALRFLEMVYNAPKSLPLSSVVRLATLGKPIRNEELAAELGVEHANDSDRNEHSNWGWPLRDVTRLEPFIPARGSQGFWNWMSP